MAPQKLPLQRGRSAHVRRRLGGVSTAPVHGQSTAERQLATDELSRLAVLAYQGVIYSVQVQIGGSSFNLIVDTGSTDVWVSCFYIAPSRCRSTCPSATEIISYGSGDVCVALDYATVTLGSLQVMDYAVGVAFGENVVPGEDNILLANTEGILGLGYPALATLTSPVGYLIEKLDRFSVYLTGDSSDGSFLLLDGVDQDLIAQKNLVAHEIPLKRAAHWTLGLSSFRFGVSTTTLSPCVETRRIAGTCDAIFDTGTSLLIVPPQVFEQFASTYLVPNGCGTTPELGEGKVWVCDRSVQLPSWEFTLANSTFILPMEGYITRARTQFLVEIQASTSNHDLGQTWIFGDTFLNHFYTSYEVGKSIIFYCRDGVNCRETRGGVEESALLAGSTAFMNPTNGSGSSSSSLQGSSGGAASGASSISSRGSVSGVATNSPVIITSSSGGSNHTFAIVLGTLAGVAVLLLVLLGLRRYFQRRIVKTPEDTTIAYEVETVASTTAPGSVYLAATVLSPTRSSAPRAAV